MTYFNKNIPPLPSAVQRAGLLHLFCLTGLMILYGSQLHAQGYCHTESYSKNSKYESAIQSKTSKMPLYLRIYIHVIRNSVGQGGQTVQNVQSSIDILNQDYNSHNIFFIWDCNIDYINSNIWFAGPANNPTGIFNVNNHSNGIDIYLFPDSANSPGGLANGVGSSSEFWVSGTWTGGIPVARSSIISHEMGHVLNLWHTHHGCESGNWENPSGTNCQIAGDFVCDTPADPHLSFNVNPNSCAWTGSNSPFCPPPLPLSSYNPNTRLIMAYTAPTCMLNFTTGQGTRMRNSITTLPYLIAVQTTSTTDGCCESDLTLTGASPTSSTYEVSNTITSTQTIDKTADVTYSAGNLVRLLPGFRAHTGADFVAEIDGCSGSNYTAFASNIIGNDSPKEIGINRLDTRSETTSLTAVPNPFQGTTTLSFQLEEQAEIDLVIFDLNGRKVQQLATGNREQGTHQFDWNAAGVPPGVYLARLVFGNQLQTIRVVLSK